MYSQTPKGYVSYGAFVGIYFEAIVLIAFVILLIDLYRNYHATKMRLTLDLYFGFLCYGIGAFFSWLGKIYLWQHSEFALEGPYWLQLIYKMKLSVIFVILGNYFLFNYFATIHSKYTKMQPWKKMRIIIKTIEISIVLTAHIPAFLYKSNELALYSDAICFFIMVLDMIFLIPYSIKTFKKVRTRDFDKKYVNVSLMALLGFNMVIMFLFDRITMLLEIPGPFGELGYSPFYFAGWISAIIGIIFAIYGFHYKLTEEEIRFYINLEKEVCLVCRGKLIGVSFICHGCNALYCIKCSEALSNLENACWMCEKPFDDSKPSKPIDDKKIPIKIEKAEKKKKHKISS